MLQQQEGDMSLLSAAAAGLNVDVLTCTSGASDTALGSVTSPHTKAEYYNTSSSSSSPLERVMRRWSAEVSAAASGSAVCSAAGLLGLASATPFQQSLITPNPTTTAAHLSTAANLLVS